MAIEARSPINGSVGVYLLLVMEETSINRNNNTSNVNVSLYIETRGKYARIEYRLFNTRYSIQPSGNWSSSPGESKNVTSIPDVRGWNRHRIISKNYSVPHNADGSVSPFTVDGYASLNLTLDGYWFGSASVSASLDLSQWTNYTNADVGKISKIRFGDKELPPNNNSVITIGAPSITFDLTNINFDRFNYKYKIWTTSGGSNARWETYTLARGQNSITDDIVEGRSTRWFDYTSYSNKEYWITLITEDRNGNKVGEFPLVPKLEYDSPVSNPSVNGLVNMQSADSISVRIPRLRVSPLYHIAINSVEFNSTDDTVLTEIEGNKLTFEKLYISGDTNIDIPVSAEFRNLLKRYGGTFSGERTFKISFTYSIDGPGDAYSGEITGRYTLADSTLNINESMGPTRLVDINNSVKSITGNENILVAGKSTIKCIVPTNLFSSSDRSDSIVNRIVVSIGNISAEANLDINRATGWGGNPQTEIVFNNSNALTSAPNTYTVTAYNTKGKQATKTYNCDIIPYSAPRINYSARRSGDNTFIINRANDDNSKPFVSPVIVGGSNKNTVSSLTINYRVDSGQWTNITNRFGNINADNNGRINLNTNVNIDGGNTIRRESQISLELVLTDRFGGRSQQNISVPSWKPLIHIDGNRSGVAINSMYPNDVTNGWLFSDTGFATRNYFLSGKNWSFNDNYSRQGIHESYGNDFDNISFDNFKAGWFYWVSSTANKPTGNSNSWGNFLVTGVVNDANNASWIHILAFDTDGNTYTRRRINRGGWSNWDKLSIGQIDLSGYTTTAVTNTLAGRVGTLESYKSSMAWLHGKLTETGGPDKDSLRLKSLQTKEIPGNNLVLDEFTEEGTFFYRNGNFSNSSIPFDYGYLTNKYSPGGLEFLQTFIEYRGTRMMTRGKNHGANGDSPWDPWTWWLNTDNMFESGDVQPINGWENYYASRPPKAYKISDHMVRIQGWIKTTRDPSENEIATIPNWAIPRVTGGVDGCLHQHQRASRWNNSGAVTARSVETVWIAEGSNKIVRDTPSITKWVNWAYIDMTYVADIQ